MVVFDHTASFLTNVFPILQHLDRQQRQVFGVTIWSIWKHKNNKVYNNVTETAQAACDCAGSLLTSLKNAQTICHHSPRHSVTQSDLRWLKSSPDRFKYNVNAFFSHALNRVGISMCIRDDKGC
jgi:hypothetical protein